MDTRILPHVERREVKAERPHPSQEPAHELHARPAAAVRLETAQDEHQVVDQLLRPLILPRAVVVGRAQALGDLTQQHAVRHLVVTGWRARAGRRHDGLVVLDAVVDGARDARSAPLALAQLLREALRLEEIAVDDQRVMPRAALADRLGVDVRQPVHIAADPRAEMQDLWHPHVLRRLAIDRRERILDRLVERRDDLVDHLDQKEEHVLALVGDGEFLA